MAARDSLGSGSGTRREAGLDTACQAGPRDAIGLQHVARNTGPDITGSPLGSALVEEPRTGGVVTVEPSALTVPGVSSNVAGRRPQSRAWGVSNCRPLRHGGQRRADGRSLDRRLRP